MAKHIQSGIKWDGDGITQLQHINNKWFLNTTKDGFTTSLPVSKKVAQALLEGGMGYGS